MLSLTIQLNTLKNNLYKIIKLSSAKVENSNYLLIKADKKLELYTNNVDIIAGVSIESDIRTKGECIIEAKLFYDLIKKLPDSIEQLELKQTKDDLILTTEKHKYTFEIIKQDFPSLEENYFYNYSVSGYQIYEMINKSAWAYAIDNEDRPAINGVLFECSDKFYIITTDLRMYACSFIDFNFDSQFKFIVTPSVIRLLEIELKSYKPKLISVTEKDLPNVQIFVGKKSIKFLINNLSYIVKPIEGTYPDIKSVKLKPNYKLEFDKKNLLESSQRLSNFTDKIKRMLSFECLKNNPIKLRSHNVSTGKLSHELLETLWSDTKFEMGFRGDSLINILKRIQNKTVTIEIEEKEKPLKINGDLNSYYLLQHSKLN